MGGDVRFGRAFVVRHPTRAYASMSDEFKEMIAIYMGAPSPLAAQYLYMIYHITYKYSISISIKNIGS